MIVRPSAALLLFALALPSTAAAEPPRIGFVNAAVDQASAGNAIEGLRALAARRGWPALAVGLSRSALEEPLTPPADEIVPSVQRFLTEADEAGARFDDVRALDLIGAAERDLLAVGPSTALAPTLAEVALRRGVLLVELGRMDQALTAFRLVRRLDAARDGLDPARYRPSAVALYRRAGQDASERGQLVVVTDPPGAVVWLDGGPVGPSPFQTDIGVGEHYVGARLAGHGAHLERVGVTAGGRRELALVLPTLPVAERAQAIRRSLVTDHLAEGETVRAIADLASISKVEALVVVTGRDGALQVAVFDAGNGRLGRFRPLTEPLVLADLPAPMEQELTRRLTSREAPVQRRGPPWYRTWWGATLVGGALGAAGVLTYVIVRGQTDARYRVGNWCVADACR
jgi:hypothetical protein